MKSDLSDCPICGADYTICFSEALCNNGHRWYFNDDTFLEAVKKDLQERDRYKEENEALKLEIKKFKER